MTEHVLEKLEINAGAALDFDDTTVVVPMTLVRELVGDLLNEYETLKAAFTIAIHLLGHADFKNGNTGPNGLIDEGEVHACRLMDKIKELVPQLYADILEGKP